MIFNHIEYNLADDIEVNQERESSQVYIFLDDNVENDNYKIVAQAISLDIRGDFGFFLNRKIVETEMYEWKGNLFHIYVNTENSYVKIIDITDEVYNQTAYIVELEEWKEALTDWKIFYLQKLGFMEFESKALSHMIGVLILTYDQIDEYVCSDEMVIEAIKKCSERYGVNTSVIYRDCRKVAGVYYIEQFYNWVIELFERKTEKSVLSEFVLDNIINNYNDIRPSILNQFGIEL